MPGRWSLTAALARECGRELPVDDHDRTVDLGDELERGGVGLAGQGQDHAVHPTALEEADVGRVQRRVVLGVHQQQRVAGAPEDRLGPQHDVRHERVGDVREHEADAQRLAAPQALGQEVRLIVELGDGRQDALAHLGAARPG